jgi:hypothetical protein
MREIYRFEFGANLNIRNVYMLSYLFTVFLAYFLFAGNYKSRSK